MTIDLDALEKLADEATPGPWTTCVRMGGDAIVDAPTRPVARIDYRTDHASRDAEAAFIAAANPATIKTLIAELRDARSTVEELLYAHTDKSIAMAEAFLARNGKGDGQ